MSFLRSLYSRVKGFLLSCCRGLYTAVSSTLTLVVNFSRWCGQIYLRYGLAGILFFIEQVTDLLKGVLLLYHSIFDKTADSQRVERSNVLRLSSFTSSSPTTTI